MLRWAVAYLAALGLCGVIAVQGLNWADPPLARESAATGTEWLVMVAMLGPVVGLVLLPPTVVIWAVMASRGWTGWPHYLVAGTVLPLLALMVWSGLDGRWPTLDGAGPMLAALAVAGASGAAVFRLIWEGRA